MHIARLGGEGQYVTWGAHPGLVPVALEVFDRLMPGPNGIERTLEDVHVTAADLLQAPTGPITEGGLRANIGVGTQYIEAWLRGTGAVPINNLMEDAATAEISRAQVWQWIRSPQGVLDDGRRVTVELFQQMLDDELARIKAAVGEEGYSRGRYDEAGALFAHLTTSDSFEEFLTLPGYNLLQ